MRGYVAPTDKGWYEFHASRGPLTEVNFWRPSATNFTALSPGEPFFFKMKAPANAIGGFGIFLRSEKLPIWLAWESLGEANGSASESALIALLKRNSSSNRIDATNQVVCRIIADPVFFPEDLWVRIPDSFSPSLAAGKGYDLESGEGQRLWRECLETAAIMSHAPTWVDGAARRARFGKPQLVHPRLGQGGFRLAVMDAYARRCCVTGEHSLPVLEAAHIKPYTDGGEHLVSNGLSLRRDLHRLFDLGYVTIRPDYVFEVGDRLRTEYQNGRIYYELNGRSMHLPKSIDERPSQEFLEYHNNRIYRAA